MTRLLRVSRVVEGGCVAYARCSRACALPFRLGNDFEVRDRNKPASVGNQRVACLVPIRIVFSADYVEKIAFGETQLLSVAWIWIIVI